METKNILHGENILKHHDAIWNLPLIYFCMMVLSTYH